MEVLIPPDQKPTPNLTFNQVGLWRAQLPILTEKDDHLHFLILRASHLREMVRLNPKIQNTVWFSLNSNLDTASILMITLFKPVKIEQFKVRSSVFQNVYGIVGHLTLQFSFSDGSARSISTLEEKIKDWLMQCKDRDVHCNFGHDIAKDFKIIIFYGDKLQIAKDLEIAFRIVKDYVLHSHNNEACPVLQQGPFLVQKSLYSQTKASNLSETWKNSEIHNLQRYGNLHDQNSNRDSQMSREPLAGLSLQPRDASTMPRGSCEVKGYDGKEPLPAATPGSSQFDAEEKSEDLKNKVGEKIYQDMSKCSIKQEEAKNFGQDSQTPSERDGKTAPTTMGVLRSMPPHVGGGGDGPPETTRKEGTPELPPTPRKFCHYPDQKEEDRLEGDADSSHSEHPSISSKNPDSSPSTEDDQTSTSSKANLSGKKKIPSHLQPAEVVRSCPAKEDNCGVKRKYFGSTASVAKARTVLLLGAKGSGKTCLVNAVANFISGVKSNAEKKLTVSDEIAEVGFSTTENITGYTFVFKDQEEDVALTLIDTPGMNDSSGNEVRDHVDSLKTFLANAAHKGLEIHCIAFVVQAHLVRLTSSERLVMDNLKTLFGQDVSGHIVNLITFADNQSKPPVVEALDHYGMSTRHCFNFNNSVFCGSSEESEKELDKAYWKTSHKNWKKCWKVVRDLSPLKDNTMKSIQKELYETNLNNSTVQELQVEMKSFLKICRKADDAKIDEARRRIWDLAHVVFHTLQESERGRYASIHAFVEQKFSEYNNKSDGSPKNLHVLMLGVPLAVFEFAKVIIESNTEILYYNLERIRALHQHRDKNEGFFGTVKNLVRNTHNHQEEVSNAEEILRTIEATVIGATFESINRLVKPHIYQLGAKLMTRSFLSLLKAQIDDKYSWMVDKLCEHEESTKNVGAY